MIIIFVVVAIYIDVTVVVVAVADIVAFDDDFVIADIIFLFFCFFS